MDLQSSLKRNEELELQVQALKKKVAQLERESTSTKLVHQMQAMVNPNLLAHHGPDTITHLQGFSLDSIIEEFSVNAPDVLDLVRKLGNCSRLGDDGNEEHLNIATLPSATALCTLLKCRSVKVLGLQLFLSIMLVAQATHKQVITSTSLKNLCLGT